MRQTNEIGDCVRRSLERYFKDLDGAKPRSVYTYKDLLELFDATTKRHRSRTAMRALPPRGEGK